MVPLKYIDTKITLSDLSKSLYQLVWRYILIWVKNPLSLEYYPLNGLGLGSLILVYHDISINNATPITYFMVYLWLFYDLAICS